MSKTNVIFGTAIAAACVLLTACEPKPGAADNPAPASAAQGASTTEPAKPSFAIFAAQMGKALNDQGQLKEAVSEVATGDPIYGVAVFRGNGPAESRVALKVADAQGKEVFSEEKKFTPGGDAQVMFTVRPADAASWAVGDYKATYVCDGAPCWEIPFKVR